MRKRNFLLVFALAALLVLPVVSVAQSWDEDGTGQAKDLLQEKFKLEGSLTFNPQQALEVGMVTVFPSGVEVTDEGLSEGLTMALTRYGEGSNFLLFVASLPELNPPYGAALVSESEGTVLWAGPAQVGGMEEGPDQPAVELLEETDGSYKVALKFPAATVEVKIPKEDPSAQ